MPRYVFHVFDPCGHADATSVDLADDREAWSQAVAAASEALHDMDGALAQNEEWRMDVVNETGATRFRLHFKGEQVEEADRFAHGPLEL